MRLETAVDFVRNVASSPRGPITTCLCRYRRDLHVLLDFIRAFEEVDVEACRDVPRNVAVEGPDSWIVAVDLNHDVSRFGVAHCLWQELDVASLWILAICDCPIPGAGTGRQDIHVVAVHMHGVHPGRGVVVHDQANGFAFAEVVDI